MRTMQSIGLAAAIAGLLGGCSLLVQPDTNALIPPDGLSADGNTDGSVADTRGPDGSDGAMTCATDCDDSNPCTVDHCSAATGMCTHTPENSLCTGGLLCDVVMGCVSMSCTTPADCMGTGVNMCNGTPTCVAGHCVPGTPLMCPTGNACAPGSCDPLEGCITGPPPDCDDGNPCTADTCATSTGMCVHTPLSTCPPGNNQCATATALTLSGGSESRAGTTVMAVNTTHSTCDSGSGGDVWYSIAYPANQDLMVSVDVSGGGTNADSVVVARDSCTSTQDIVCNDDIGAHDRGSRIWIRAVPGAPTTTRTIYIDVEAYMPGAESTFLLTASVSGSIGAATCAGPFFDTSSGGTIYAHTTSHSDGLTPSCAAGTSGTPQDVYTYAGTTGSVRATATPAGTFTPVLSSRGSCIGYDDDCQMGSPAEVNFNYFAGREYLVVSNGPTTSTPYWLAVHIP